MSKPIRPVMEFYEASDIGAGVAVWYGSQALDGTAFQWRAAPVGSIYVYRPAPTSAAIYGKTANNGATADWVQLDAAASAADYPATQLAYGACHLRNWNAELTHIRRENVGHQAVLALFGDSWMNIGNRFADLFTTWLQTEYGDAGPGWVSMWEGGKGEPPNVTRTRTGTWTDRDKNSTPKGRGPDLSECYSDEVVTPAKVTITATCETVIIHYLEQVGGGDFRWQVDAGGWTTVSTDAAEAYATTSITGLSAASHAVEIEILDAGTAGVILFGADVQESANGVRVHRFGQNGGKASDYTALDATQWQTALTALAPTVVAILLGTNEDSGDVAPATFRTNMEEMATRVRTAIPLCDILYISPGPNDLTPGTYGMADYVAALRASAVANDYAMFDSLLLLGDYDSANSRDLYQDSSHVNATGGSAIVRQVIQTLLYLP